MKLIDKQKENNVTVSTMRGIENLHVNVQSAVLFNGSTADWFRTTFGVQKMCLLSSTLFSIFLKRTMFEALNYKKSSDSIGGRRIPNFHFADGSFKCRRSCSPCKPSWRTLGDDAQYRYNGATCLLSVQCNVIFWVNPVFRYYSGDDITTFIGKYDIAYYYVDNNSSIISNNVTKQIHITLIVHMSLLYSFIRRY